MPKSELSFDLRHKYGIASHKEEQEYIIWFSMQLQFAVHDRFMLDKFSSIANVCSYAPFCSLF